MSSGTARPFAYGLAQRGDVGVRRFLGATVFTEVAQVDYDQFVRWRKNGPVYVPEPVVVIGERGGWPLPLMQIWTPTVRAGDGPVPEDWLWPEQTIVCADSTRMAREYCCSSIQQMWALISAGEVPPPTVAIGTVVGWPLEDGCVP